MATATKTGRTVRREAPAPPRGDARLDRISLVVVLLVAAAAFAPVLTAGFTNWDDPDYVSGNADVMHPSPAGIAHFFGQFYVASYVPLTMLSLALDALVWRGAPFGFHLGNLLYHLASTALAFAIARRLDGRRIVAIGTALLFAVHPLRVEPVAWLSARKDVLGTLFFLAALAAFLRWVDGGDERAYAGSIVLLAASLLAKSMGVTFPVVAMLVLRYRDRPLDTRALLRAVPYGALAAATVLVGFAGQSGAAAIGKDALLAPYHYVLVAAHGLLFYLVKTAAPFGLAALYPYPPGPGLPLEYWLAPLLLLALGAVAVLALRGRTAARAAAFGAAFFAITVLPVLQLVPLGFAVAADRYAYLPSFGLAFALASIAAPWLSVETSYRTAARVAGAVLVLALAAGTALRCGAWHDSLALWNDTLRKQPASEMAYMLRARAHLDAGRRDDAIADYRRVTELPARSADGYNNRGVAWTMIGDDRRAILDFERAIALSAPDGPTHAAALGNRGSARLRTGDVAGARADLERATALRPWDAELLCHFALATSQSGDVDGALAAFDRALELDPAQPAALVNRGVLRAQRGRVDAAFDDFSRAIAADPKDAEAWYNRALVWLMRHDDAAAIADLTHALELDPAHADARRRRAEAYWRRGERDAARRDADALARYPSSR